MDQHTFCRLHIDKQIELEDYIKYLRQLSVCDSNGGNFITLPTSDWQCKECDWHCECGTHTAKGTLPNF